MNQKGRARTVGKTLEVTTTVLDLKKAMIKGVAGRVPSKVAIFRNYHPWAPYWKRAAAR